MTESRQRPALQKQRHCWRRGHPLLVQFGRLSPIILPITPQVTVNDVSTDIELRRAQEYGGSWKNGISVPILTKSSVASHTTTGNQSPEAPGTMWKSTQYQPLVATTAPVTADSWKAPTNCDIYLAVRDKGDISRLSEMRPTASVLRTFLLSPDSHAAMTMAVGKKRVGGKVGGFEFDVPVDGADGCGYGVIPMDGSYSYPLAYSANF
ncbi:hypothetical protein EDB87DRAFT_1574010 [Lactarius vividus]|nr:hypothetical protein EDB87DRAFT_1574010 [Lactarius vividus]